MKSIPHTEMLPASKRTCESSSRETTFGLLKRIDPVYFGHVAQTYGPLLEGELLFGDIMTARVTLPQK
jgi:hypothetical protein